jgi:peptide/nickel transport system permease protein
MFKAPWLVLWPGVALSVVVYGVNMFGDALRDILDPRLRGGVGRYGVKAKRTAKKSPKEPAKSFR